MPELSVADLKELLQVATDKTTLEMAILFLPSVFTLFTLLMSYFIYKKHAVQITNEKVIEKDVEKLYEAVDEFFEYSDSIRLYFSMKEKQYKQILDKVSYEDGFKDKVVFASNDVYGKFSKAHRSSFLMRALGEISAAEMLDAYIAQTVNFRKDIFSFDLNNKKDRLVDDVPELLKRFSKEKQILNNSRNQCLQEIVCCKKRLRAPMDY